MAVLELWLVNSAKYIDIPRLEQAGTELSRYFEGKD